MKIILSFELSGKLTFSTPPRRPGAVTISQFSEEDAMILFEVSLPTLPVGNPDNVVKRQINVTVGEEPVSTTDCPIEQTVVTSLKGPQGAEVTVSLIDFDEVGNPSPAQVATAVLTDVFPPAQPGVFTITPTGEEPDAPPAP